MRVLMISWEYPPSIEGGLGRHVAELGPALVQQGVELHVVTPTTTLPPTQSQQQAKSLTDMVVQGVAVSEEDGVIVHRVLAAPKRDTSTDIFIRAVKTNFILETYAQHICNRYGPWDIIHVHDWLTSFAGVSLQKNLACNLIATIHATERGRFRGHLENHLQHTIDHTEHDLVTKADRVIVCSRHMFNELQSFFQAPASKLDIVPNGVDISGLNNDGHYGSLTEFRSKYAASYEKIVFTISRLVYEKGVHRLIEAAPRILANCPATTIVVAGRGPEADNLKQKAQDLGVASRINFVGFISDDDRNCLFKVADCAVFPSLYEPFGIVALEAMALGCPVVVSEVGGFAEMVAHTETGITTYPDNADSVAWGVSQALTHPELARKYAFNAKKSVAEEFNWTRIAGLTKNVYKKTLSGTIQNQQTI